MFTVPTARACGAGCSAPDAPGSPKRCDSPVIISARSPKRVGDSSPTGEAEWLSQFDSSEPHTNRCNGRCIRACTGGAKFVSYLRVSTDKQGRSGLGLEAQRVAVESYLNGGRWTLIAEYVEAESGKRSDRPELAKALAHAKAIGATVVFAKLDRLTRNVDLLRSLVASNVDLVFCDLPHVPPGAMGRFLLTQMASVAELEVGLISERTRAALAAARHAA